MKVPLRYQMTEYDCGATSLLNCISFLYAREEVPAEVVKIIPFYTLDTIDEEGDIGERGTTKRAVITISNLLMDYSKKNKFDLRCKYYLGTDATFEIIKEALNSGACINFRTKLMGDEHYVTLTQIDDEFIYIFDPYFLEVDYYKKSKDIQIVHSQFSYNRKIKLSSFLKEDNSDYAMGNSSVREVLIVYRKPKK